MSEPRALLLVLLMIGNCVLYRKTWKTNVYFIVDIIRSLIPILNPLRVGQRRLHKSNKFCNFLEPGFNFGKELFNFKPDWQSTQSGVSPSIPTKGRMLLSSIRMLQQVEPLLS